MDADYKNKDEKFDAPRYQRPVGLTDRYTL
jgi:hypothetical protein